MSELSGLGIELRIESGELVVTLTGNDGQGAYEISSASVSLDALERARGVAAPGDTANE